MVIAIAAIAMWMAGPFTEAASASDSSVILAQAQPKNDRSRLPLKVNRPEAETRRRSDSSTNESSGGATTSANVSAGDKSEESGEASSTKSKSFIASLRGWIKDYAMWIVVVLVGAAAGLILWLFLGRSAGSGELVGLGEEKEEKGRRRYSTTKIRAGEVAERLEMEETEVDADREYALVVDEDALKKPPLPEEIDANTGQVYADASTIEELLDRESFDDAYEEYERRIEEDGEAEFQSGVEESLGEQLLRRKSYEKAARVLEHHVATHAAEDVAPEVYFNLGYVHFFRNQHNKSKRFLKLYVERETDGQRATRAKKILTVLDTVSGPETN